MEKLFGFMVFDSGGREGGGLFAVLKAMFIALVITALMTTSALASNVVLSFEGSGESFARSVKNTSDGGYIAVGSYFDPVKSWEVCVVKYSKDGVQLWQKHYGGSNYDEGSDIIETSSGDFVIAGATASFGAMRCRLYLLKIDANGNLLWEKAHGGPDVTAGTAIQKTPDGSFIIAGYTTDSDPWLDFALLKVDANGNLLWEKYFGNDYDDRAWDVKVTQDGGFIIAGNTGIWHSPQAWMVKTDGQGGMQWSTVWGGSEDLASTNGDLAKGIWQTSDGGYVMAGQTSSFGANKMDGVLLRMDADGNPLWHKLFGGSEQDRFEKIVQKPNGNFVIVGTKEVVPGQGRPWKVEVGSEGNPVADDTYDAINGFFSSVACGDNGCAMSGIAIDPVSGLYKGYVIIEKASNDTTPPVITISGVEDGATYILGNVPTAAFTATDDQSGIASQYANLTGGNANGVGAFKYVVNATDKAGNASSQTVTYSVVYQFGDFQGPIANNKPLKFGRVVPITFALTDSVGTPIANATVHLTLQQYSNEVPVGEPIEAPAVNGDGGNIFRYDSASGLYVFNLDTKSLAVGTWLLTVTPDDGTTQSVLVMLK